jgi:hypothetical protein
MTKIKVTVFFFFFLIVTTEASGSGPKIGKSSAPFPRSMVSSSSGSPNTFYVTDFGAVCNGVADDTLAIQAAYDRLKKKNVRGSKLVLPFGTCKVTDTLDFSSPAGSGVWSIEIEGQGHEFGSQLRWHGRGDAVVRIDQDKSSAGCISDPKVTIAPPLAGGSQAKAIALRGGDGTVDFIHITEQGSGYTSIPRVTLSGGGCKTQATATARLHSRKPMMRIRGMTMSYFHDFSMAASDSNPVATLITLETKKGSVVRSNRFERMDLTTNNSCGYEKGIQIIDGRSVPLNFPGLKGSGIDGNNDINVFDKVECDHYSVACFSFEMSQSKANHIMNSQMDACGKAFEDTKAALIASGDVDGINALDMQRGLGQRGRGPYGVTSALGLGGGQSGNGGAFMIDGTTVMHKNIIDFYLGAPNDTILISSVNSENSMRFVHGPVRGWSSSHQPLNIFNNRFSTTECTEDKVGTIQITGGGPINIWGNTFDTGCEFRISRYNNMTPVSFWGNSVRWKKPGPPGRGSVDQSPFLREDSNIRRWGNSYVNKSGATVMRKDEQSQ